MYFIDCVHTFPYRCRLFMTSKHSSNIFGQQLPFNVWKMQGNQSHYACHGVM